MKMITLLLLLSTTFGFAQSSISYLRTSATHTRPLGHPDRDNLIIPFELLRGMIVLNAEIDEQVGQFILDTGAPMIVINDQPAAGAWQGASFQQAVAVGYTRVKEFAWAGDEQHALEALVVDISHLETAIQRPLEGMIGYNALNQYELFFDYERQSIMRCSPRKNILHQSAKPLISLPIEFFDHLPVITVQIGNKKLRFGLDTGACANLIDPSVLAQLDEADITTLPQEEIQGLDQAVTLTEAVMIDQIQIKHHSLESVKFLATDLSALRAASNHWLDGLLGYEFLKRLKFSINYPKGRMYIWACN